MSLSNHEIRKQPTSLRNRHATHLFGSDGFENLDFVLNKAAEISIRVLSFFFFFFFFFFCDYCRFLTLRAVLFSLHIQVSTKQDGRLAAFFGTRCLNFLYL